MRLFTLVLLLASSRLMAQDPANAQRSIDRGLSALRSANYRMAVDVFQRAIQIEPSNASTHFYLGVAWMEIYVPGAQNPENVSAATTADAEFRKVLALDPKHVLATWRLASLDLTLRKLDGADALVCKVAG